VWLNDTVLSFHGLRPMQLEIRILGMYCLDVFLYFPAMCVHAINSINDFVTDSY